MVLSQPLSTWINSRLQNNALSVIGIFMFLFGFCASRTAASAQAAYVQQCSSFGDYVESAACTLNGVGAGHALVIGVYVSGSATPTYQLLFRHAVECDFKLGRLSRLDGYRRSGEYSIRKHYAYSHYKRL